MPQGKAVPSAPVTNNVIVFHKGHEEVRIAYQATEYIFYTPRVGENVFLKHDDAGTITQISGTVARVEISYYSTTAGGGSVTCGADVYLS